MQGIVVRSTVTVSRLDSSPVVVMVTGDEYFSNFMTSDLKNGEKFVIRIRDPDSLTKLE